MIEFLCVCGCEDVCVCVVCVLVRERRKRIAERAGLWKWKQGVEGTGEYRMGI